MAKFSDRVFGSNVDPEVLKKFKRLQSGILEQNLNEPIVENQDYLGDRTTFARMWTASLISGSINDKSGKSTKIEKVNFHVVNDNRGESYKPNDPIGDNELSDNPYLKPKAGITSISTKNEGSLGVIKNTTVEFVVHNKVDFESIFLPFFMKPGATVIVDYGWSDSFDNLYDVKEKVTKTDTELSEFKRFIYGGLNLGDVPPVSINAIRQNPKSGEYYYLKDGKKEPIKYDDGFLEKNAGLVDTVVGVVKNFNATITQQGSFNCTIDLVSQNTTLLDQEITNENNLKFIFANQIEDTIVAILTGNSLLVNTKLKMMNDTFNAKQKKLAINKFFEDTLNIDDTELGVTPKSAVELGFFYQNLTPTSGTSNDRDLLYMSFGRFEDLFLNNLIAKTTTKKGNKTIGQATGKFDTNFNFRNVWIRFDDNLYTRQKQIVESNEALPVFLYPENWTSTYDKGKGKTSGPKTTPRIVTFKVEKGVARNPSFTVEELGDYGFHVKESNKRLFIIYTLNILGQEPLTLNHIIDGILSPAKDGSDPTGTLRSFSYYSSRELSKADVPTADEIIAANPKDLADPGAKADTPLVAGTYAIPFKVPIPEGKVVSDDVISDRSTVNDYETKIIPLRELFISVDEISKAFSTKQNINDAIDYLLERINKDSYDVLKLKMYSPNRLHSSISITDANLMPPQTDEMLIFDVTSGKSIVSDLSYNFQTPKGGFASMIAIGDKTGTQLFDEQTKDTLNFLKVLEINKFTETPDKVYYKSLPLNTRDETQRTTEIEFDFESIAAHDVETAANKLAGPKISTSFVEIVKDIQYNNDPKKKKKKKKNKLTLNKKKKGKDGFLFGDSFREYFGKKARLELIYSGQDSTVSPILPIELSLTVYGNTYLNNGDIFSINFLPKSYSKRVYFQIVGVEQKLQPAGWATSYTTIMRVDPNAKKEAVDEKRKMSLSKLFTTVLLKKYDRRFVNNLMNVVESSFPIINLPNGYTGCQINTDYSLYGKDELKIRDDFDDLDSRVLSNSFTPATNATDFLYIYAMTATIYSFMETAVDDKKFTVTPGENIILLYLKDVKVRTTKRMRMKLQLGVAVASTNDGVIKNNPLRDFLQRNQKSNPAMSLEDTIINYRTNIIKEFSDYIKDAGNFVNMLHSDPLDEYGGLIHDFHFKLSEYDGGKVDFWLIKTPNNIKCINSLRMPYWFASPVDFIKKLDFLYKKLLKGTNNGNTIKQAWLAEATVAAKERSATYMNAQSSTRNTPKE